MCLSVVGCSSSKNDSSATKNQILYVSMKDIFDINTHLYTGEMAAQNMVFESLVVNNADREVEPGLAESWEISEDGLEYTFKLREDVTFTDGETKNSVNGYAGTGPFMLSKHEDANMQYLQEMMLILGVENAIMANPRFKIKDILVESLVSLGKKDDLEKIGKDLLKRVGLLNENLMEIHVINFYFYY